MPFDFVNPSVSDAASILGVLAVVIFAGVKAYLKATAPRRAQRAAEKAAAARPRIQDPIAWRKNVETSWR